MPNYQPSPDGTCSRECAQWNYGDSGCPLFDDGDAPSIDRDICPLAYRAMLDVARIIDKRRLRNGWLPTDLYDALDAVPPGLLEDS